MKFKEFIELKETGTSTADIAGFSRITLPMVTRMWPTEPVDLYPILDEKKGKKKFYRIPQLDEGINIQDLPITEIHRFGGVTEVDSRIPLDLISYPSERLWVIGVRKEGRLACDDDGQLLIFDNEDDAKQKRNELDERTRAHRYYVQVIKPEPNGYWD